jgi:hypothetical protein
MSRPAQLPGRVLAEGEVPREARRGPVPGDSLGLRSAEHGIRDLPASQAGKQPVLFHHQSADVFKDLFADIKGFQLGELLDPRKGVLAIGAAADWIALSSPAPSSPRTPKAAM